MPFAPPDPLQILPAIDLRGGRCVRLRQGDYGRETVFSDDPAAVARQFADAGAARIHVVDLDGAKAGEPVNTDAVRAIVAAAGEREVPVQLGGGVRTDAALAAVFGLGVERAIVGTAALKDPEWFAAAAAANPGRLVLGLDARDGRVAVDGWTDTSGQPADELLAMHADLPLAAVVFTNIADDGMMAGMHPDTLHELANLSRFGLPLIASGGVTSVDDVAKLAELRKKHPHLVGAIVGRALYEGTLTVERAIAAAAV